MFTARQKEAAMPLITHPHVLKAAVREGINSQGDSWRILLVETDLATTPSNPSFDEVAFNSMMDAVSAWQDRQTVRTDAHISEAT
jgi:hypothetical protein